MTRLADAEERERAAAERPRVDAEDGAGKCGSNRAHSSSLTSLA